MFPHECDIFELLNSNAEENRLGGGAAATKRKGMSEILQMKHCLVN